jgi:hypothetical protein
VRFTLHGTKTLDLRAAALNGDLTFASFITADDGGALVAYESSFTPIELEAGEFDRYLKLEGLDEPLRSRARLGSKAGPGRERYARCPKTWIGGRELGRLLRPVGLPLEVVPVGDPTSSSPVKVKLLFRGRPLAGALVRVWNQPLEHGAMPRDAAERDSVGPATEVRTDRTGLATLSINGPGEWLVSAVHMVRCADRAEADWESLWASLTFARGAGGGEK